jgi:glycerol kinase
MEIWASVKHCIKGVLKSLANDAQEVEVVVAGIGITNQRETTIVWNKTTGRPYSNAIVWNDTRTRSSCDELCRRLGQDGLRQLTGLPIATYFR